MLFSILICILIQVADTQYTYYSTGETSRCYANRGYCLLCGCFETGITQHTLRCGQNEVIRMEISGVPIKSKPFNITQSSCALTNEQGACKAILSNENVVTTLEDRVAVYKLCTLQNTCAFTVKPVSQDRGNVKLVRYPYICEKNFLSMSNPVSLQVTDPVLYFTGKDHVGENINCECTVTPSDQQTMELEIFYINGDNICNHVTFNSLDVIQCNNNTQLYTNNIEVDDDVLNITIKDITAAGDDVLYFKVHGNRVRVTCSGCLQNTDPTTSMSESTNQDGSITITTSMSSNGDQSTTMGNQQSDMTGFGNISQAEYDEKLKANNAMFGGIIAAILIATLLVIGIYCFIRKRKKSQKPQTEKQPPVSPQSNGAEYTHYHYIDVDLPNDTDISNQQTETTKQPNTSSESKPNDEYTEIVKKETKNETTDAKPNETAPNVYFEVDPDVVDDSSNDKQVSSKIKSVKKPEERNLMDKKSENPNEFIKHGTSLTRVKNELKKELEDTFNQEGRSQNSQILSNSDEQSDDTYNHIGDTIEPIVTPKALSQNPINPSTEGNHNNISLIPPVTANPHELNKDNYNHIGIGQAQKVPKSTQSDYNHIDDTLVIRDYPADIEDTYSHIEDNPQLPTPKPAPRLKNKDTKSVYLPTTEDLYENIDMELKADNSERSTSMYDGEIEDTYDHLGNTNIVKL